MDDTTTTILLTAIVTTLGTAAVTWIGHRLTASKDARILEAEQRRHARYLAIRVVCVLDRFVSDCTDVVADDGATDQAGVTTPSVPHPSLKFPSDIDWKMIEQSIMYRVLALPNALDEALRTVRYIFDEVASPPDFDQLFEARRFQFSKLGLLAMDLSEDIRREFLIPPVDRSAGFDPRIWFVKYLESGRVDPTSVDAIRKLLAKSKAKQTAT